MNEIVETKNDFEELQFTPADEASEEIIKLVTSQEDEYQEVDIAEKIQTEIDRRFQSAKDKRWAKLEKQYEALKELVEDGKEQDLSESQTEIDILSRGERLLEKANLQNHPELLVKMNLGEYTKDISGYVRFLEDVSVMVMNASEDGPESTAGVIQPGGGVVPVQDLRGQYESARKKLSPGDLNGLTAIKRDFRKKGLEVF